MGCGRWRRLISITIINVNNLRHRRTDLFNSFRRTSLSRFIWAISTRLCSKARSVFSNSLTSYLSWSLQKKLNDLKSDIMSSHYGDRIAKVVLSRRLLSSCWILSFKRVQKVANLPSKKSQQNWKPVSSAEVPLWLVRRGWHSSSDNQNAVLTVCLVSLKQPFSVISCVRLSFCWFRNGALACTWSLLRSVRAVSDSQASTEKECKSFLTLNQVSFANVQALTFELEFVDPTCLSSIF